MLENDYKKKTLRVGAAPNPRILYLFQFNLELDAIVLDDMPLSYEEVDIVINLLALLPKVRMLSLNRCKLDDIKAGLIFEALAIAPSLVSLSIDSNEFSSDIVKSLAKSLESSRTLKEISIADNKLGDKGALYLAKVIPYCYNLYKLVLNKNLIGDEGVKELCKNLVLQQDLDTDSSDDEPEVKFGLKKSGSSYKLNEAKPPPFKVSF